MADGFVDSVDCGVYVPDVLVRLENESILGRDDMFCNDIHTVTFITLLFLKRVEAAASPFFVN